METFSPKQNNSEGIDKGKDAQDILNIDVINQTWAIWKQRK